MVIEGIINDLLKDSLSEFEEKEKIEKIKNHPDRIYVGTIALCRSKYIVSSGINENHI